MLDVYRAINNRRLFGRCFKELHARTQTTLFGSRDIQVLSGPFKGLKYYNEVVWGPITPKWLGSYETELSQVIEEIIARDYTCILDIGCAEGYYAVGLAYRLPKARIIAYDTDFISRRQAKRLARLNRVEDRVSVFRYCSHADISRHAAKRPLVVCDIEGFERSLLDPQLCASLRFIDILVEVHEGPWEPTTMDLLTTRFKTSHSVNELIANDREDWMRSFRSGSGPSITHKHLCEAVNEHRSNGQRWLWMKAKQPSSK